MSLPSEHGTKFIETAVAAPPLDPPALKEGLYGLAVGPKILLTVCDPIASSDVLVFPIIIAPFFCNRFTKIEFLFGKLFLFIFKPSLVGKPITSKTSLIAKGMPFKGKLLSRLLSLSFAISLISLKSLRLIIALSVPLNFSTLSK